ncbi:MAG: peptidyl-prolyl cis-trans isomerase [Calditrichaceae bacterium]|nr:peptidylprolyl isomerase [Calditrichia bacterium]NUQ41857.1 peptidyl-prolyl cis-trans isomerase [Calditrichaceae bacterium]
MAQRAERREHSAERGARNNRGIFAGLALLLLLSCGEKKEIRGGEEQAVARVGDKLITVQDFRRSYETGFAHLKTGPDRKRTYLKYMINEKLLALEGYRLGLHQAEWIRESERMLLNELLIEALIETEVKSKIKVAPEEIRAAINQSKVSFKFRYWVEASREEAHETARAMRERGYAEVVDEKLRGNPELRINPQDLESDYLNGLETPPELLEAIQDLPYGDISEPVFLNDRYYIFQVLDIRRRAVTENEYLAKASTFEQTVFYRKFYVELERYGVRLMESRGVSTPGKALNLLGKALVEWEKSRESSRSYPGAAPMGPAGFKEAVHHAPETLPALKALRENLSQPFTVCNGGTITFEEFLDYFRPGRIASTAKDKRPFSERLKDAAAEGIRDYFLAAEGRKKNLEKEPGVRAELALWRDKWVYEAAQRHFTREVQIGDEEVKEYFAKNKQRYKTGREEDPALSALYERARRDAYHEASLAALNRHIDLLKERYPVRIYEAALDTVTVIDFRKSRWASMQLYKSGVNRLAYPAVDPGWSSAGR